MTSILITGNYFDEVICKSCKGEKRREISRLWLYNCEFNDQEYSLLCDECYKNKTTTMDDGTKSFLCPDCSKDHPIVFLGTKDFILCGKFLFEFEKYKFRL